MTASWCDSFIAIEITKAKQHIYASLNLAFTGSDYGLLPARHQAIT